MKLAQKLSLVFSLIALALIIVGGIVFSVGTSQIQADLNYSAHQVETLQTTNDILYCRTVLKTYMDANSNVRDTWLVDVDMLTLCSQKDSYSYALIVQVVTSATKQVLYSSSPFKAQLNGVSLSVDMSMDKKYEVETNNIVNIVVQSCDESTEENVLTLCH